jgi:hypothetical protein
MSTRMPLFPSTFVTNDYPKNLCSLLFAGRVASTRWSIIRTDTTILTLFAPYGAPETVDQALRSPCLRWSGTTVVLSLDISIDLNPRQVNSLSIIHLAMLGDRIRLPVFFQISIDTPGPREHATLRVAISHSLPTTPIHSARSGLYPITQLSRLSTCICALH